MFKIYPAKRDFLGLILFSFISFQTIAQIGIGNTNPNTNSLIEIGNGTDTKGVLLPRVSLVATTNPSPLSTDVEGMIVYNTNTNGSGATAVNPGFYYNDGTDWIRLAPGESDDWKLTGNAGTTPGTNFLGTTDNVSLELFTNNTTRMRVENDGQVTVGYGATLATAGNQFSSLSPLNGNSIVGNTSGSGTGVRGISTLTGYGVRGDNSGTGKGVLGIGASTGVGVQAQNSGSGYALASFNTGTGSGIYNSINNSSGIGIYNNLSTTGGTGNYVNLGTNSGTGIYVLGVDIQPPGTPTTGGDGFSFFTDRFTQTVSGTYVYGAVMAGNQFGVGHGVILNHYGVQGRNGEFNIRNSSNNDAAIFSVHNGSGSNIIAQNQNDSPSTTVTVADFSYTGSDGSNHIGVSGFSVPTSSKGIGVQGTGGKYGVVGISSGGDAIFADGDSNASGTKSFVIDHPNYPANKYLKHFSIESNEVLNVYRGTTIFNSNGRATVQLPEYYTAINKNASYQLTAIGASMPNLFIEKEVGNSNTFVIAGGIQGKKVSWTLTAERNDPYLQQNPNKRKNVLDKGDDRGKYLMPQLYNQTKENGMFYKEVKVLKPSTANEPDNVKNLIIPKALIVEKEEAIINKKQN